MVVTLGRWKWYSLKDLAGMSGLRRKTLWNLVRSGQLRAKWISGRWHVRDDTWESWCGLEDSVIRRAS